jgi:hypothetical protein
MALCIPTCLIVKSKEQGDANGHVALSLNHTRAWFCAEDAPKASKKHW